MEPVGRTAPGALKLLLDAQPTTTAKVAFAWRVAAGPALGRAGLVRRLDRGVLIVAARDAAWRSEIERARGTLVARLRGLLGDDLVRHIVVEAPAPR